MKNYAPLILTIATAFSLNCFAQKTKLPAEENTIASTEVTAQTPSDKPSASAAPNSYHVEENINMIFGGYTITYDVSKLSMVNTNDLGMNNTRVVTPRFEPAAKLPAPQPKTIKDTVKQAIKPVIKPAKAPTLKADLKPVPTPPLTPKLAPALKIVAKPAPTPAKTPGAESPKKGTGIAYIDFLKTYERVAEKGYRSADVFRRLGNAHYFNGELEKAAKWYTELLTMTSDFEPEVYFRYATALKSLGQNDKAKRMMEKFDQINAIPKVSTK